MCAYNVQLFLVCACNCLRFWSVHVIDFDCDWRVRAIDFSFGACVRATGNWFWYARVIGCGLVRAYNYTLYFLLIM